MSPAAEKTKDMIPADEVENILADRVAAEVAKQLETIQASLSALKTAQPASGDAASWMEALAQEIARVSNGGIGQKPVPPEELEKRRKARERMEALIEKTVQAGVQPTYRLTAKVYLGEQMIQPIYIDRATKMPAPMEIGWWAIPNEYMHPTNPEAEAIHAAFLESIGGAKKHTRLRVTPGGLVVRSGGMPAEGGRDSAAAVRTGPDVYHPSIRGKGNESHAVETRILGTLMPPARQMV